MLKTRTSRSKSRTPGLSALRNPVVESLNDHLPFTKQEQDLPFTKQEQEEDLEQDLPLPALLAKSKLFERAGSGGLGGLSDASTADTASQSGRRSDAEDRLFGSEPEHVNTNADIAFTYRLEGQEGGVCLETTSLKFILSAWSAAFNMLVGGNKMMGKQRSARFEACEKKTATDKYFF